MTHGEDPTADDTVRTAIVTGGASGIGFEVCVRAARLGYRVAVLDQDESAGQWAVERLGEAHMFAAVDVRDAGQLQATVATVRQQLGSPTALVTAAGVAMTGPLDDARPEDIARVFDINTHGTIFAVQAVLPAMRAAGSGTITTLASVAALRGGGLFGNAAYSASKGAVVSLSRALARELAPSGIRVNCVAPGPTMTPMLQAADEATRRAIVSGTPLGRFASPGEIADGVAFLLSDAATYVIGETLNINGGTYIG